MLDDVLRNSILVDLTQTLGPDTPMWSEDDPFIARTHADHENDGMYFRYLQMSEHSGTHMDAPIHFGPGQATMDEVPLGSLVTPVVVADARTSTRDDPDFTFGEKQLDEFETEHGKVASGSAFLLCTGWDRLRHDPVRYIRSMRFPGFGPNAVEILVDRGVVGIGIDTLSVDAGREDSFPVHHISQPNGLWHLEGLVNLDRLPARGAWLVAAPLLLAEGSGSPARVFAIVPSAT